MTLCDNLPDGPDSRYEGEPPPEIRAAIIDWVLSELNHTWLRVGIDGSRDIKLETDPRWCDVRARGTIKMCGANVVMYRKYRPVGDMGQPVIVGYEDPALFDRMDWFVNSLAIPQ